MSDKVKVGWYLNKNGHDCHVLCINAPISGRFKCIGYITKNYPDGPQGSVKQWSSTGLGLGNDFTTLRLKTYSETKEGLKHE